jgi:hypothetical protein
MFDDTLFLGIVSLASELVTIYASAAAFSYIEWNPRLSEEDINIVVFSLRKRYRSISYCEGPSQMVRNGVTPAMGAPFQHFRLFSIGGN